MQPARTREPLCTPGSAWAATRSRPYKATIDRGLWPDVLQQQGTSVAKAKKAIADCKMGVGYGRWAG